MSKRWSVLACVLLVAGAANQASATVAITLDNLSGPVLGNPPFTLGWQFVVNQDIQVSHLGVFDGGQNGLVNSYLSGIWNAGGGLLTSTTVAAGVADPLINQFRYHATAPVILSAGQTYRIGALYLTGNDPVLFPGFTVNFASDPAITFSGARFAFGGVLADPVAAAGGPGDPAFFGSNFQFTPVPEPGTVALLALGLAGLALRRRR